MQPCLPARSAVPMLAAAAGLVQPLWLPCRLQDLCHPNLPFELSYVLGVKSIDAAASACWTVS